MTNQQKETKKPLTISQNLKIDTICGIFSGTVTTGLASPIDRALYLSVKNQKPFLSWSNFKNPYQGALQAVTQRAIVGSAYFIAQGEMRTYLSPLLKEQGFNQLSIQLAIGTVAGMSYGLFNNGISVIKYHTWGQENRHFISSARELFQKGGVSALTKGTGVTIVRDIKFGWTYEVLRYLLRTSENQNVLKSNFLIDAISASCATVVSGPYNYARNIIYATPPERKPLKVKEILKDVWHQSKIYSSKPLSRVVFFQTCFRIGWGTARVGLGMTLQQTTFDKSRKELQHLAHEQNKKHGPSAK